MKPLVIIIVFVSHGYFCNVQGKEKRKSDEGIKSPSSSLLLSKKQVTNEENNTGIIHETTKRILQYASDVQTNIFSTDTSVTKQHEEIVKHPSDVQTKSLSTEASSITKQEIVKHPSDVQTKSLSTEASSITKQHEEIVKHPSDVQTMSFSTDASSITKQMDDLNLSLGPEMPSEDEINILKRFKKTNLCIKYNGYLFIKLRRSKEKERIIFKQILQKFMSLNSYYSKIIHINDPKFLQFFQTFTKYLYQTVSTFFITMNAVEVINELNLLILDLILHCEVPVPYFVKYHNIFKTDITFLIDFILKNKNMSNSPAILLNIWLAFKNPDVRGSISCVKTRLLVLFNFLNNITSNKLLNDVEEFIYKFSKLQVFFPVLSSELKLVTTAFPDKYRESWEYLNEYTSHIIKHFIKYLKDRPEITDVKMKSVIMYLEYSLCQCGVPREFLYDHEEEKNYSILKFLKEKFLSDKEKKDSNINFFETYTPNTLHCFKASIDNLFDELLKVNKACSKEYHNYLIKMADVFSNCGKNPDRAIYFQCITNFENLAVEALPHFESCLFSDNENINSKKVHVANIFTQFRNFYLYCGATPKMMEVRWNE